MKDFGKAIAHVPPTPPETIARARAAIAVKAHEEGWTAQETRDVLEALGVAL